MKKECDVLMMNKIKIDLVYTSVSDKSSKRKIFLTETLPKRIDKNQNKIIEEIIDNSDNLEGRRIENYHTI